jgi:hypothetical protein
MASHNRIAIWLDSPSLEHQGGEFIPSALIDPQLGDAYESLPQIPLVRASALPVTAYTAGDTKDPGFQRLETPALAQNPSRVRRRYAPLRREEFSGLRSPDPVFPNLEIDSGRFAYPLHASRPTTLMELFHEEEANFSEHHSPVLDDDLVPVNPVAAMLARQMGLVVHDWEFQSMDTSVSPYEEAEHLEVEESLTVTMEPKPSAGPAPMPDLVVPLPPGVTPNSSVHNDRQAASDRGDARMPGQDSVETSLVTAPRTHSVSEALLDSDENSRPQAASAAAAAPLRDGATAPLHDAAAASLYREATAPSSSISPSLTVSPHHHESALSTHVPESAMQTQIAQPQSEPSLRTEESEKSAISVSQSRQNESVLNTQVVEPRLIHDAEGSPIEDSPAVQTPPQPTAVESSIKTAVNAQPVIQEPRIDLITDPTLAELTTETDTHQWAQGNRTEHQGGFVESPAAAPWSRADNASPTFHIEASLPFTTETSIPTRGESGAPREVMPETEVEVLRESLQQSRRQVAQMESRQQESERIAVSRAEKRIRDRLRAELPPPPPEEVAPGSRGAQVSMKPISEPLDSASLVPDPLEAPVTVREMQIIQQQQAINESAMRQQIVKELRSETETKIERAQKEAEALGRSKLKVALRKIINS